MSRCKRGHELAGWNLQLVPRARYGRTYTERRCRACAYARWRSWYRALFG